MTTENDTAWDSLSYEEKTGCFMSGRRRCLMSSTLVPVTVMQDNGEDDKGAYYEARGDVRRDRIKEYGSLFVYIAIGVIGNILYEDISSFLPQ